MTFNSPDDIYNDNVFSHGKALLIKDILLAYWKSKIIITTTISYFPTITLLFHVGKNRQTGRLGMAGDTVKLVLCL